MREALTTRDCRSCQREISEGETFVLVDGRAPYHRDCYRLDAGRSTRRSELALRQTGAGESPPRRRGQLLPEDARGE